MSPRLHGTGLVVEQQPAAGSVMDSADVATLWLERRPRAPATAERP
jgi:beta-lactam-binding protein with PASTA domain